MIYEYRVYEATPGQLPTVLRVLETAMPYFNKHGMKVIGCWTTHQTISENSNRFIYMLAFEDLAHLERAWKAFRADEEWHKARQAVLGDNKTPYLSKFSNYVMSPTSFSSMK